MNTGPQYNTPFQEENIDIKTNKLKFAVKRLYYYFNNAFFARRKDKTASHGAGVNGISFRIPAKEFTYFAWNC